MKVEPNPGSLSLIVLMVSVDVRQHWAWTSRTELRSCAKVKVTIQGSPSPIVLMVSVDVRQHWTWTFPVPSLGFPFVSMAAKHLHFEFPQYVSVDNQLTTLSLSCFVMVGTNFAFTERLLPKYPPLPIGEQFVEQFLCKLDPDFPTYGDCWCKCNIFCSERKPKSPFTGLVLHTQEMCEKGRN